MHLAKFSLILGHIYSEISTFNVLSPFMIIFSIWLGVSHGFLQCLQLSAAVFPMLQVLSSCWGTGHHR